jgi:hypothetical protein
MKIAFDSQEICSLAIKLLVTTQLKVVSDKHIWFEKIDQYFLFFSVTTISIIISFFFCGVVSPTFENG